MLIPRQTGSALRIKGTAGLLDLPLVGIIASLRTPLELCLPFVAQLDQKRDDSVLAGPFQSPLERVVLEAALSRKLPVVIFPARDAHRVQAPPAWRSAMTDNRLAIVSEVGSNHRRASRAGAVLRDRCMLRCLSELRIAAATRGGRAYQLARDALALGIPVGCMDHPANSDLILLGCDPIPSDFYPRP